MRSFFAVFFLSAFVLLAVPECPPPDCPPPDGFLTEGSWGGEHWLFEVDAGGIVYVETDCAHGTSLGPVMTIDGNVAFKAEMAWEGGPVVYPPPEPSTFPAEFVGTVCDGTLTFTYNVEGGSAEGQVVLGEPALLMKCQ